MNNKETTIPKEYIGGGTNLVFDKVSNPYKLIIKHDKIISCDSQEKLVDLTYYAKNNIPNYTNITELPQEHINYLNSIRGNNMSSMLRNCNKLTSIDLSKWDTSRVTNMFQMFKYCSSLTNIDCYKLNTINVTNMVEMFDNCESLTSLDLSKFNTSNVNDMSFMFYNCRSLNNINLSNFNTNNIIDMGHMFYDCINLTNIIGVIYMTSCKDCVNMFHNCDNLTGVHLKNVPKKLDLSNIGGTEGTTYIIDNYIDYW